MEKPLPVVIHPAVIPFLQELKNIDLIQRIRKCLAKLSHLQLDRGLIVKKLRGISRKLWEARIDQKSRLIFSFYKSYSPEINGLQTHIAVQDIYLEHDNVKMAREVFPDDTWINLKAILLTPSNDIEADNLNKINSIEEIENEILEELEISEDDIDQLLSNIPWRIINHQDDWNKLILNQDKELPLKLSEQESEIATHYGNILLSGVAGTGKTTVGLYRLLKSLQDFDDHHQRLYVAYNPLLVNYAQEQFNKLIDDSQVSEQLFQFNTIKGLCLEILESQNINLQAEDTVDFQTFEQMYLLPEKKTYPASLVWEEIRGLIKGSQLSTQAKLLSETEYKSLGRGRAFTIPITQREKLYRLANWYQRRLNRENRFDEIDLARKVLKIIQETAVRKYQMIVCDEIQDLTEIQIELLLQLLENNGQILFTGDINQMISPSGFRWEDLGTRFYQHNLTVEERTLKHNFRSINSLSYLAYQFLKLRSRLLEETLNIESVSLINSYQFGGRIIQASLDDVFINLTSLQSGDAILVRKEAEKEQLKQQFGSELIFTIEEAKGLEFDTVFLVNFFQLYPELWHQTLYQTHPLNAFKKPRLRLELNLLYVAITRARRCLYLWEDNIHQLWQESELQSYVSTFELNLLREERQLDNSNWLERGEYYFKAEFYPQAMECFEKGGDLRRHKEAKAKHYHKQKNYQQAAELYLQLQQWQQAAELFERIKEWQNAVNCWQQINNQPKYYECLANLLEENKQYQKAGEIWQHNLDNLYKAATLFERAQNWQNAFDCWWNLGVKYNYQQQVCQGKILEIECHWEEAAILWHKLKRFNDERKCWFNSDNRQKQAEYLVKDYENRKEWLKVAQEYEILQDFAQAAKNWQKAAEEYQLNQEEEAKNCNYYAGINLQKVANSQQQNQQYNEALSTINFTIDLVPNLISAYLQRVEIHCQLKNYTEAITDCEYIVKIEPNCAQAYKYRAKIYLILAKYDLRKTASIQKQLGNIDDLKDTIRYLQKFFPKHPTDKKMNN